MNLRVQPIDGRFDGLTLDLPSDFGDVLEIPIPVDPVSYWVKTTPPSGLRATYVRTSINRFTYHGQLPVS